MIKTRQFSGIIFAVFLALWIANWAINLNRNYLSHSVETKSLFLKPLSQKWAYVFGDELNSLLFACVKTIPLKENLLFVHNLNSRIAAIAAYFLYPRMASNEAKFIVVYKQPYGKSNNCKTIYKQAEDIYILKCN